MNTDDSDRVSERVLEVIARETHRDRTELRPDATLDALNVDSVDVVMILNGIEEEFQVYLPVEQGFSEVKCLQDFVSLVTHQICAQAQPA
jgi:acyl carrier protein